MIVQRMTISIKPGRMDEVLTLLKEDRKRSGFQSRLYQIDIGTFGQIAIELEFEDMAAREKFWTEWGAVPERPAFMEKWLEYTKSGGTEIWTLVE